MSGSNEQDDVLTQIKTYQNKVLEYEAINDEIDRLIMANDGASENMSADDLARYRELAHQRDELLHEIRWLEQQLLDDGTDED